MISVKSSVFPDFGYHVGVSTATERTPGAEPGPAATASSTPSKGERTRLALLDHAIRRFAADGFRATSLADIARDANVTPAAAYVYFANKEALFTEAVGVDTARLLTDALTPTLNGSFDGDWRAILSSLLDGLERHRLARRLLQGLEPDFTERMLDMPALADLRAGLAALLAEGQTTGEVRTDIDPDVMAMGLEMTVMAVLIAALQTGIGPEGDRMNGVVAVLDAAITPPPDH
jgi:AcrR family transcriptional regulator